MANHRFNPHHKVKSRGGSAHPSGERFTLKQRGGMGAETAPPGAGSPGFRSALHSSGQKGKQPLKMKIAGPPSRFAQGGNRHGMHIGGQGQLTVKKAKQQK